MADPQKPVMFKAIVNGKEAEDSQKNAIDLDDLLQKAAETSIENRRQLEKFDQEAVKVKDPFAKFDRNLLNEKKAVYSKQQLKQLEMQYKNELKRRDDNLLQCRSDLREMVQKVDRKTEKMDKKSEKLDTCKSEFAEVKAELVDVKAELVDVKADNKKKLAVVNDELVSVKDELVSIKDELVMVKDKWDSEKKNSNAVKEELIAANEDFDEVKDNLDQKNQKLDKIKIELIDTRDELVHIKDELVDVKDELVDAKVELVDTKEELVETKDELGCKNEQLDELKDDLVGKQQELDEVKNKVDEVKNELGLRNAAADAAMIKFEACQTKLEKMQNAGSCEELNQFTMLNCMNEAQVCHDVKSLNCIEKPTSCNIDELALDCVEKSNCVDNLQTCPPLVTLLEDGYACSTFICGNVPAGTTINFANSAMCRPGTAPADLNHAEDGNSFYYALPDGNTQWPNGITVFEEDNYCCPDDCIIL